MAQRAKSKKPTPVVEVTPAPTLSAKGASRKKIVGEKPGTARKVDKKQGSAQSAENNAVARPAGPVANLPGTRSVADKPAAASRGAPASAAGRIAELEAEAARLTAEVARMSAEIARLQQTHELVVNRIDWVIDSLHNLIDGEK